MKTIVGLLLRRQIIENKYYIEIVNSNKIIVKLQKIKFEISTTLCYEPTFDFAFILSVIVLKRHQLLLLSDFGRFMFESLIILKVCFSLLGSRLNES